MSVYFEFNKNLNQKSTEMIFIVISQTMINRNCYQSIGDQYRRQTVKQIFQPVIQSFACAKIACPNKYWRLSVHASAIARYSLAGLIKCGFFREP